MYLYFLNVLSRQDELSSRQVKNWFGRLVWRVTLDSYLDGRKSLFETFDFIIWAYNYYSCTVHDEVGFEWREQGNWGKNTLCFMSSPTWKSNWLFFYVFTLSDKKNRNDVDLERWRNDVLFQFSGCIKSDCGIESNLDWGSTRVCRYLVALATYSK